MHQVARHAVEVRIEAHVIIGVDIWREPVIGEGGGPNGLIYLGDAIIVAGARPDLQSAKCERAIHYRAEWGYQMLISCLTLLVQDFR